MKLVREKTKWSRCPYPIRNHDYMVSNGMEFCFGMRKAGTDKWEKWEKRKRFNKAWRQFETLDEKIPKEFVEPYTSNPWDAVSYNSLESFM